MEKYSFTQKDREQIKAFGIKLTDVYRQMDIYRKGPNFLSLIRPCRAGDGIRTLPKTAREDLINLYHSESAGMKITKFVPASGAASRMFASWYAAMEKGSFDNAELDRSFFSDLRKMPFYDLIKKDERGLRLYQNRNIRAILQYILEDQGLHFGWLPKALIPFHRYQNGIRRTALEEHIEEAAGFIANNERICRLHFTISTEHVQAVQAALKEMIPNLEKRHRLRFQIDLSLQSPSTNVIAVDSDNQPLRDEGGQLIFRPGGHGALIVNLQKINADLIFVKNIDNIVPETCQENILPYKKILGGLALQLKRTVGSMLGHLEKGPVGSCDLQLFADFCRSELQVNIPKGFSRMKIDEKRRLIYLWLNRPLRVCGMVKNEGEPGGGPFWVLGKNGVPSLQIVESVHVDKRNSRQAVIWSKASYFNPVDMVCCTKDHHGRVFPLGQYIDRDAYLISLKTEKGHILKAQELPGLWNGGMADWNTVFVELPIDVFNPVKTVYDLLRPEHQAVRIK